ncbi:sushi, nidogen and EGF-like domain-containing protein 1 [Ditylenchus destructor]|nr:sushi, nidogen and EGF-like domain-containing protein 1 [Ditylenchus destructor]
MLPRIFLIYILVLLPACLQGSVPEKEFVPNGEGTKDAPLTDKHSPLLLFNPPIRFYGNPYDNVYVNYEGAISFGSEVSYDNGFCNGERSAYPVVAPFWMNASKSGKVYYRQIELGPESEEQLSKPLNAIKASFPAFATSNWHQALVVTWHNAIIVTGRNQEEEQDHTFVVFFYDSVPHDPNATAFLGFDSSYEARHSMQRACENDSIKVEVETNLNKTLSPELYQIGQWVYRVDVQTDKPGSLCPALSDPSYGYCRTKDYHPGDTAECGCNNGPEKTIVTCVGKDGSYYWAGGRPVCPEYTTTVAPEPETTTDGGSHSSPVSFLQTIPMLLLTFFVAFYLC